MSDPIRDRIERTLLSHRLQHQVIDGSDYDHLPLLDALSTGGDVSIGRNELELLADEIAGDLEEVLPASLPEPELGTGGAPGKVTSDVSPVSVAVSNRQFETFLSGEGRAASRDAIRRAAEKIAELHADRWANRPPPTSAEAEEAGFEEFVAEADAVLRSALPVTPTSPQSDAPAEPRGGAAGEDWVIVAEFESGRQEIVRGPYPNAYAAGCVRTEMELDPPRYAPEVNLFIVRTGSVPW